MHPILFHVGPIPIYSYSTLVALGGLIGLWYCSKSSADSGLDSTQIWDLGIYMMFAGIITSKIWLLVSLWLYMPEHRGRAFDLMTLQSGGTYYGGIVGATVTLFIYASTRKVPFLALGDVFATGLPLGHAIGRLGCFLAGCCYGKPTSLPWGIAFESNAAHELIGTPLHSTLHPTQLYEAIAEFLIFLLIRNIAKRQFSRGCILGIYMASYGITRFTLESLRGDYGRGMIFNNSASVIQVMSLGMAVMGCILLLRMKEWDIGEVGARRIPRQ